MSDEKSKKTEQNQPEKVVQNEELLKGEKSERLYSEKPVQEGYQPTDKLDTSNPPTENSEDKSE